MYTVLLTDDEPAVLDSLRSNINWHNLGVQTILTATDGYKALEILQDNHIDLLITDICMPNMDGIVLLQQVRRLYPNIHCILLTAYSDFGYAREAIKLGVENYLLKPFQQQEMNDTIEKALDNIYFNRENSRHLFRRNILLRWVTGNINVEELSERSGLLNINVFLAQYCVLCIKMQQSITLSTFFSHYLEELCQKYEVHHFWDDRARYVFIIGGSSIKTDQLVECLTKQIEQFHIKSDIVFSIGSIVNQNNALYQSYQEACELIDTADLSCSEMMILTKDKYAVLDDDLLVKELNMLFHQHEEEERKDNIYKIAKSLQDMKNHHTFTHVLTKLVHNLLRLFLQEFPEQLTTQKQIYQRMQIFSVTSSEEDFIDSLIDLLEYSYLLFSYYFEQLSPIVQYAITYIHKNYKDGISLKEFCLKSKINTAYLGGVFRKETGMFFNNYLVQYRICCSIQLLKNPRYKINDIADAVGFSSTSYYITCFKKQTGMSPIKYRTLKLDYVLPAIRGDQ